MPNKYTDELKPRAVDLLIHAQDEPSTANGPIRHVDKKLGLSSETLRTWVRSYKSSGETTPARSIDLGAENKRLRAVLVETKRANEILKKAASFFAAECRIVLEGASVLATGYRWILNTCYHDSDWTVLLGRFTSLQKSVKDEFTGLTRLVGRPIDQRCLVGYKFLGLEQQATCVPSSVTSPLCATQSTVDTCATARTCTFITRKARTADCAPRNTPRSSIPVGGAALS